MGQAHSSDPLRVLQVLVGLALAVLSIAAVVVFAGSVIGSNSLPGVSVEVCVDRSGETPAFRQVPGERTGPVGLSEGIAWRAEEVTICDPDPDATTRALGAVGLLVWAGGPTLFFALLWRFLRRARQEGVFADRVPAQLRRLGAVLLVWAALDFVVSGVIDAALLTRMTDHTMVVTATVQWVPVLLGIALLALARVMGEAVVMRRDVEATI